MLSCYRRIPYSISKNIRTFCLTTNKSLERVPLMVDRHDAGEFRIGTTKTKGHEYRLIDINNNGRVLMILNPRIRGNRAYCSVRIGVGSDDDPDDLPGLAHLLEHVITRTVSRMYYLSFHGRTFDDCTFYSFETRIDDFLDAEIWSQHLFSDTLQLTSMSDIESTVKRERKRVDEEFYEKQSAAVNDFGKLQAILKSRKMIMPNFGWGNMKTLKKDDADVDHVIEKLEELRSLYQKRPVFACIYTPWLKNLNIFCKSWIFKPLAPIEPVQVVKMNFETRNPENKDFSKLLFVIRSDSDLLQLRILFPFNRKLTIKESRTIKFFRHLLESDGQGSLTDYLLNNKLGVRCEASFHNIDLLLTVNLTKEGLADVQTITSACFKYFQFLVDEWERLDECKQRFLRDRMIELDNKSDSNYAEFIAKRFDVTENEFDEINLFKTSNKTVNSCEEQHLIAEQIIKNKNVVHSIVARDIDEVAHVLKLEENGREVGKEDFYRTSYVVFKTELFKNEVPVTANFKMMDKKNHKIAAFINESKDVAYQQLCLKNVSLQGRNFLSRSSGRFYVTTHGIIYGSLRQGLDPTIRKHFEQLRPFTMDDVQFGIVKNFVMRNLSIDMTNSMRLARSLLATAVENVYRNRKIDPIPIQYNTMRSMKTNDYIEHFEQLHHDKSRLQKIIDDMENTDFLHHEAKYDVNLNIRSINKNEPSTVTLHFYEIKADDNRIQWLVNDINHKFLIPFQQELGLYEVTCYREFFGQVEGIVLKTVTVENNEKQSSEEIQKKFRTVVDRDLYDHLDNIDDSERLTPIYYYMKERSIRIQVVGQKEIVDRVTTFDNDFHEWFGEYKGQFIDLIDVTKIKQSNLPTSP